MPQDQTAQNAPQGENPKPETPGPGGIDLGKILLPKKDGPSKDSAQRVNAGALLEAEQSATLPKTEAPPIPAAQTEKKEESSVKPIETYRGDIEELVQTKNVSVLNIAAAEAGRRGGQEQQLGAESGFDMAALARNTLMVLAGAVLLAAAGGALWWVLRAPDSVEIQTAEASPFIKVDETRVLTVPPGTFSHEEFMQALTVQRDSVEISLGLIARLQLAIASTSSRGTVFAPFTATMLLQGFSPEIPGALLRAIQPDAFLLGVHSFDSNQVFLLLEAESYEGAYAAMLSWERTMQKDLSPLFTRPISPTLSVEDTPIASATASTTATTTSGLAATSTASSTESAPPPPQEGFVDKIVENHDARVIESPSGEIVLLWTFLNRKVLLITTNDATVRELVSRLNDPSVVPTP